MYWFRAFFCSVTIKVPVTSSYRMLSFWIIWIHVSGPWSLILCLKYFFFFFMLKQSYFMWTILVFKEELNSVTQKLPVCFYHLSQLGVCDTLDGCWWVFLGAWTSFFRLAVFGLFWAGKFVYSELLSEHSFASILSLSWHCSIMSIKYLEKNCHLVPQLDLHLVLTLP